TAELEDFEFLREFCVEKFQPLFYRHLFEDKLFRNNREIRKIGRDVIREAARILDIDDDRLKIIRQLWRKFDDPFELAENGPSQCLKVDAGFIFLLVTEN